MSAPLHPAMPPGRWWGCEHPERPYDDACNYHNACRACWLAAKAATMNGYAETTAVRNGLERTLAAWVERHAYRHGVPS